ncbi:hypothetical protein SEVIR_5G086950v4 [Setaria viridis]|uniref:Uncharacterized protein n=1 Tax=Setaria viridis TaxID=4556 RepID=A0A4U6UQP7_SETVI|nr:protein NEGATIVE REGULATOR OF RESISTANCE-like [Setaria viridis]TKW13237.1 hypothetical protein SEVIR_5G086950v2 [Setaria viridis]
MEPTTATAKRKRAAADIAGEDPAPAAVDEASDAEVEEFYAILRRMRDASRRICGAGARPAPRAPAWRPSFCWEDFADPPPPTTPPAQARPEDEPVTAAAAERSAPPPQPRAGLDLNAEPEPEAPSTPATPRSARVPA